MRACQARRGILRHSTANYQRADPFFLKAGFVQILSLSKSGTPPCKSGQLEKDLGLEASSVRHAARLIIFEIIKSFFVGSKLLQSLTFWICDTPGRTHGTFRTLAVSVRALFDFNFDSF